MDKTSFTIPFLLAVLAAAACADEPLPETAQVADPASSVAVSAVESPDPADLLPNGKMPLEGVLTGGQPTPEQLELLAEQGYQTLINMRSPSERGSTEPATVEALGMTYVSIPVAGADDVNEASARRLAEALSEAEKPVVVHCGSGNRVGAVFAMKAFYVDGDSPEDSLAVGREAGVTRLEPMVKSQLGLE